MSTRDIRHVWRHSWQTNPVVAWSRTSDALKPNNAHAEAKSVDVFVNAVLSLAVAGFRRGKAKPPIPIRPSPWTTAAAVLLALVTATAVLSTGALAVLSLRLANDWMFLVLGMVIIPAAFAVALFAVGLATQTVPVSIRLVRGDAAVRLDLGMCGGTTAVVGFVMTGLPESLNALPAAIALTAAGLYMLGIAIWPQPWRHADVPAAGFRI